MNGVFDQSKKYYAARIICPVEDCDRDEFKAALGISGYALDWGIVEVAENGEVSPFCSVGSFVEPIEFNEDYPMSQSEAVYHRAAKFHGISTPSEADAQWRTGR